MIQMTQNVFLVPEISEIHITTHNTLITQQRDLS